MALSKKNKRAIIISILLLLIAAGAAGWFLNNNKVEQRLPTAKVQRGDLQERVTATGTLNPKNYVDVGAQISGQLLHLHVEIGSDVEAGQLLAEIDARVLEANVAASRAQLRAQAAQLRDRKAQLKLAGLHYQRQKMLRKDEKGNPDHNNALTGDDLIEFVDRELFPYLKSFKQKADRPDTIEHKIGQIFGELRNKIQSGYSLRDALDRIDELRFRSQEEKHELSHLYETRIKNMGNAGRNGGEYYTPQL